MYLNLYGKDIEAGISLPVKAIKLNLFTNISSEDKLDILGRTILKIIKIGEVIDKEEIAKMLGFVGPLEKIVGFVIEDLKKNLIIDVAENGELIKIDNMSSESKVYYALYDLYNKNILECFIPEERFNELKWAKNDFIKEKNIYRFEDNSRVNQVALSLEIKNMIDKVNKFNEYRREIERNSETNKDDKEEEQIPVVESYMIPHEFVALEKIVNFTEFIDCDFLIKAINDESGEAIKYQWPFTNEYESVYVEKYIESYFNEDEKAKESLKEKVMMDDLYELMNIGSNIDAKIAEYKNYYLDDERYDELRKILHYQKVVALDSNDYKNIENPIGAFDKIIKYKLKKITDTLGICKKQKGFNTRYYLDTRENDSLLVKKVSNRWIKGIKREADVKRVIGETSIYDYLTMILIAPYILKERNFEILKFRDILVENKNILDFMSNIWLLRNNTGHSVEKGKYYDEQHDIALKSRGRISEDINEAVEDLNEFLEMFAKWEENKK